MMLESEYDEIWQNWLKTLPEDTKASGNEEAELLERKFDSYSLELKQELIDVMLHVVLTQGHAHWIALIILEKRASIEHRRKILELYQSKVIIAKTWQDEWYLNNLIDALSYEPTDEFVDVIEEFLLDRTCGTHWARPVSQLFKTHPDIYLKGWPRYFSERPFDEWRDSGDVQMFLFEPETIAALKNYMLVNNLSTWEKFKQALLGWIDGKPEYAPSEKERTIAKKVILS